MSETGKSAFRRAVHAVPGHKYLRRSSDKSSIPSLPDITTPRNASQISVESRNVVEEQNSRKQSSDRDNSDVDN